MMVALELTHHVHEMLQYSWAGDGAILCDVPDEEDREAPGFCVRNQAGSHGSDLRDPTRGAVDLV